MHDLLITSLIEFLQQSGWQKLPNNYWIHPLQSQPVSIIAALNLACK